MQIPGRKWLIAVWGTAAVIWSVTEGDLLRVQLFGFLTALTGVVLLRRRLTAGRQLSGARLILSAAGWGLALGVGTAVITLLLMAIKTGLHGHGPEFTADEILMVWQRLPLWSVAGLLGGLGLGLLQSAVKPREA